MTELTTYDDTDESVSSDYELLDETDVNYLVQTPSGDVEFITKGPWTTLLLKHDLWGLLKDGDDVWVKQGTDDEPRVRIIPDEAATTYQMEVGQFDTITLAEHQKTDLIDALMAMYEEGDGESVQPLVDLYESIREDMVREQVLTPFADQFPQVEVRDTGWFINGHLLLSWDREFTHPETTTRQRSGNRVVREGANEAAYQLRLGRLTDDLAREVTVNGVAIRLTDAEMRFLAKGLWAIENTPDERA